MNVQNDALLLTAGIGGVLVLATLTGMALKFRLARGTPHAVIDNLNARIKAWWVMAALLGLALWIGKLGVLFLFAFASVIALREFATLAPTRRGDHFPLALCFFALLPLQYFLVWVEWYAVFTLLIPVYAFLIIPIAALRLSDTRDFMHRTSTIQWGLMLCVFCLSHVPALLMLDIPDYQGRNALLLVFLVLVVQSSDVLQYVWGKLFGRRKIAPGLSPSKTVEGFIGGVLSATALGASLYWITPFSPLHAAWISAVITIMGFFGGLVLSAIKRDRGVKDWGTLIEGHGGMLDRMDSICFSAPIFFHIVRYWWTP